MRAVHEAVEDGVGHRRVGEHLVPRVDGELAGDDRAAAPLPIVEDLQEIAALIGRQMAEPPARSSRSALVRVRNSLAKRPSPWASSRSANKRGTRT